MFPAADMASGNINIKSKTPKQLSVSDMANRLAQLELENKSLKRRIKDGSDSAITSREENILSSYQKEALISSATSKLSTVASKKIELKIRNKLGPVISRGEAEEILKNITLRLEVSLSDIGERVNMGETLARRGRASSRVRDKRTNEKRDV